MKFIYHDGGRKEAGYKGKTGDCVVRAICIITGMDYRQVWNDLQIMSTNFANTKNNRIAKAIRNRHTTPRSGVYKEVFKPYLASLGYEWCPTMSIGSGCRVHMVEDELPSGRIIVSLSRHVAAVIDGVLYDTHDCTRGGKRCVYGYFRKIED